MTSLPSYMLIVRPQPLQTTVVRVGLELGIFQELVEAGPSGRSVDELYKLTGAEASLVGKLRQYTRR